LERAIADRGLRKRYQLLDAIIRRRIAGGRLGEEFRDEGEHARPCEEIFKGDSQIEDRGSG
jgi:hypothetical protein